MANTIYKTRHKCHICHDYMKITNHNADFNYYKCKKCNVTYVYDRKNKCFTKAYEIIKF